MRVLCLLLAFSAAAAAQDRILEAALDVARRDHPALSHEAAREAVRSRIKELGRRYRLLLGTERVTPARRADTFRRVLFPDEPGAGFLAVEELDSSKHLHIDTVLKGRRGYCLSLSVLALAIAEEVGAPLYGVATPNHFFVRYDDGKYRRNLEMTRRGIHVPDEELRKQLGRVDTDSIYLRNLKPSDVKAYLLHNRGYVALQQKKYDRAFHDFTAAIVLQPGLGEAHRNLGVVYGERKMWKKAKRSFAKALSLYARDINALINLAICRNALGDRKTAIQELEMALALDPGRARAEALLARWKEEGSEQAEPAEKLPPPPPDLEPGLLARIYAGLKFEVLKTERVDSDIDFDWQNEAPSKEAPRDRFTARWEGWFLAPRTGTYTFFLVANDGVRLFVGGESVLENWKNMAFRNWFGHKDVALAVGWHRIKIEHYDIFGGARLMLRVGVEGRRLPLDLKAHLFHTAKQK